MLKMHTCSQDTLSYELATTYLGASVSCLNHTRKITTKDLHVRASWIDTTAWEARRRCLKRTRLYLLFLGDDRYTTVSDLIVNWVDARGLDLDQNLTSGSGRQRVIIDELQDFRRTERLVDHCLHTL